MTLPVLAPGQRWYAAFTQPNSEMRAAMHLNNQEFPAYVPRFLKRRRSGRRVETVTAPLFPRYVFLGADLERQRWRSVNGTIGVSHLVCQGDRPTCIDDRIIAAIAEQEDESGLVQLKAINTFKPGQQVRVVDGIFADQLGLYEGLGDHERVKILLGILGRKVRVLIETAAVAAA